MKPFTAELEPAREESVARVESRGHDSAPKMEAERLVLARGDVTSAAAGALIAELNSELLQRYPEEGTRHFRLDPAEVSEARGAFLVACFAGAPVACGAVRRLDAETAEIKRMYVTPGYRGRGIARQVLGELEAHARLLGATRLVLETGDRQPEALALYVRAGFVRIPKFGQYVDSPLSVCMGKTLTRWAPEARA